MRRNRIGEIFYFCYEKNLMKNDENLRRLMIENFPSFNFDFCPLTDPVYVLLIFDFTKRLPKG